MGLPGHLIGKFRLLIEGIFQKVSLYATRLENLILIKSQERPNKYYGITPEKVEEFIFKLKEYCNLKEDIVIGTPQELKQDPGISKKNKNRAKVICYTIIAVIIFNTL